jgi:membrane protease YdiL (CAAX protease family)
LETLRWTLPAAAWGSAAALPVLVLFVATDRLPVWPFSDIARVVDELFVPLFRGCGLAHLAVIAALAGLGEEMLFRGFLQEAIGRWVGGPSGTWVALAAASLLFGLVHPFTLSYVLLAALIGLYLGWLWIATGNLLVPIAAHAVYDFLALAYLVKIRDRGPADDDRPTVSDEEPAQE